MTTQTETTWRKVKLGDIADLNMGQSPKSEFYNDLGEGLPFFQGVTDFGERVPEETMYCSKPAKVVERGDVLISVRAPVGDVNIAEKESCIGRGVAGIRAKDKNNEFLYYLLLNFKDYIRSYSGGTTYESINKDALRDLEFLVPESSVTRQQIANTLSTYDDLIENNTKRIKILEEIAQAIYREWFVNNSKSKNQSAKLQLKTKKIGDIFDVKYGKTLPTSRIEKVGKYPVYGAGGVIGYFDQQNSNGKVTLVTCRGNGSGTVWRTRGLGFVTNNSLLIVPKEEYGFLDFMTIYFMLASANVDSAISGSAQPQITIESLNFVDVVLPEEDATKQFQAIVEPNFDLVDSLFVENQNLRQARDLLLPKLVTGEIPIK